MYIWDTESNAALSSEFDNAALPDNDDDVHGIYYAYLTIPKAFYKELSKTKVLDEYRNDIAERFDGIEKLDKAYALVECPLSVDSANYVMYPMLTRLGIPFSIDYVANELSTLIVTKGMTSVDCVFSLRVTRVLSLNNIDTKYPTHPAGLKNADTRFNKDIYKANVDRILSVYNLTHSLESLGHLNENT